MKTINRKSRFLLALLALSGIALIPGNGISPLLPPAAAQAAENTITPSLTNAPATNAAVGSQASGDDKQLPRNISGDRVRIGGGQKVRINEAVNNSVTVFGSSDVAGFVDRDMVTVFGTAKMNGEVNHDMVTTFGDADVNGPVGHDLVVVFGSLKLGPNAKVGNDCVAVFGKIDRDPKAVLAREPFEVMPWFSSLGEYVRNGPLMGRPLPPGSGLAWIVVGFYFLLYFLVALILPKPVAGCVRQLDHHPLLSFGVGILTLVLLAPLCFILAATGVGVVLIPFIGLAELAFVILGKASALEFIGLQIQRRFSANADNRPILAFLTGFILLTLLYMVPILGLLVWLAFRPLALGAAVLSAFSILRKNGTGGPPPAPGIPVYTPPPPADSMSVPPPISPVGTAAFGATAPASVSPPLAAPVAPPNILSGADVAVMPRAGFWIRLAATALDFILLVWLIPFVTIFFPFFWLAYHVAMWSWKGTTVGGIVCNLKLVRLDGRPVDFAVALVRGLASVFSFVALFTGFFWAGWTRERQSWHDLIAGTVIVRVPKAVMLI